MIQCVPKSIFSWNYDVFATDQVISVEFNWLGEQGLIKFGFENFAIKKIGLVQPSWSLLFASGTAATAHKPSAFARSFDIETSFGTIHLVAQSVFGRTMLIKGMGFDGVISPDHFLTRKASITGDIPDLKIGVFAFWLTVLLWRRASRND